MALVAPEDLHAVRRHVAQQGIGRMQLAQQAGLAEAARPAEQGLSRLGREPVR
jgi:hypothetical protein